MRRWLLPATVCLAGAVVAAVQARAPDPQTDNLIAFARLYGVVRWFYPGDDAAGVDWDRVAVLGASRVRAAGDAAALQASLESIFRPIAPDLAIGPTLPAAPPAGPADSSLVAWRYYGAAVNPADTRNAYAGGRTNHLPARRRAPARRAATLASPPPGRIRRAAITSTWISPAASARGCRSRSRRPMPRATTRPSRVWSTRSPRHRRVRPPIAT